MSAKNLCTQSYWKNVRRHENEASPTRSQEPCSSTSKAAGDVAAASDGLCAYIAPSEEVSTIAASTDGLSERSSAPSDVRSTSTVKARKYHDEDDLCWDEIRLGHRFQPYRQYAHGIDDVHVLATFLELASVDDVNGDSVKILLRAMKLLHLCDYSAEDICSTLAHASYYFLETFSVCGKDMDLSEIGHVLVTLMFIAHVFVQDETCPLKVWHQHLFRRYCPLRTLNAAVMRLMHLRSHILRLPDKELNERYRLLMQASRTRSNSRLTAVAIGATDCICNGVSVAVHP